MGFSSTQLGLEENAISQVDDQATLESIKKNLTPERPIAVQVKNACKTYGRGPPILENLNMTVPRGTIYGLLGASGCGKTTILSSIVGLKKLDSGDIWVYGARPGSKESGIPGKTIGYMPQDIALYQKFTIEDIWTYLVDLVSRRRTTVIITTHYIDEAKNSHTVGLMRNGKLLVEQAPKDLLEEHQADLLEDIVLKLCRNEVKKPTDEVSEAIQEMSFYTQQQISGQSSNGKNGASNAVVGLKFKPRSPDDDNIVMQQRNRSQSIRRRQSVIETVNNSFARQSDKVFSLVRRNFLTLFRNPIFVVGLLIMPTFQTVLFNYIVGREPINKRMGVVNGDFENRTSYCADREPGCFKEGLSCDYMNRFGNNILWDNFETADEAFESVKSGAVKGFMEFPDNFTTHMKNRALHRNYADNETLVGSTINFHMDFSDYLMNVFLLNNIFKNYLAFAKGLVEDCGGDSRLMDTPLKYNAIYGSLDSRNAEYMQPPQILLIMFLLPMTVAVTYIWDKKSGTLDRTMVAGVDYFHVVISLLVTEGLLMIIELILCLATLIFVFNFKVQGSLILCFALGILTGICGLSFGFLFGVMCDHEIEVLVWSLFVYLPTMVSSGSTPREGIEPWAKLVTGYLPITKPAESIRSIVTRGWGITHPLVYPGFVVLLVWISLCWILSGFVYRMRR
ncbi:ABC transporter G family member 20 [Folsomia candida]|uniref:ABC transporter G family member 20 n=1 Tax=Folsomia candida TaxID=158441 RepID=A0A226EI09_FOLCA|nr:ABC transporter G family member 20 [Folsomia candida]